MTDNYGCLRFLFICKILYVRILASLVFEQIFTPKDVSNECDIKKINKTRAIVAGCRNCGKLLKFQYCRV